MLLRFTGFEMWARGSKKGCESDMYKEQKIASIEMWVEEGRNNLSKKWIRKWADLGHARVI